MLAKSFVAAPSGHVRALTVCKSILLVLLVLFLSRRGLTLSYIYLNRINFLFRDKSVIVINGLLRCLRWERLPRFQLFLPGVLSGGRETTAI